MHYLGIVTDVEKRKINGLINFTDLVLKSLISRLNKAFNEEFSNELNDINEKQYELWKHMTGGELMDSDFVANEVYLSQCHKKIIALELCIKELILKINSH